MTDYSKFQAICGMECVDVDDIQCNSCASIIASGKRAVTLADLLTLADEHVCVERKAPLTWRRY